MAWYFQHNMNCTVIILPEADQDADRIYRWIAERSTGGANRWYEQFLGALRRLVSDAEVCGLAPENEYVDPEIRQLSFKTRKGLRYRILFSITGGTVHVLHVRGPGQSLLGPDELRSPH